MTLDTSPQQNPPRDNPPPNDNPVAVKGSAWRRVRRAIVAVVLFLIVVIVMLLGTLTWIVHTESGTRFGWQLAGRVLKPKLGGTLEGGSLQEGVRLRNVSWHDKGTAVSIDRLSGRWRLSRSPWRFTVDYLRIGNVDLRLTPQPAATPSSGMSLPQSLVSPLQLDLKDVRVESIMVRSGTSVTELGPIALHGGTDGRHHRLVLDRLTTPFGALQADVKLDGAAPFATVGDLRYTAKLNQQVVNASATLTGTLARLNADVAATGMKLAGRAHIEATPFDQVPVQLVAIAADHLNPQALSPSAPAADLRIRASLRPVTTQEATSAAAIPSSAPGETPDDFVASVTAASRTVPAGAGAGASGGVAASAADAAARSAAASSATATATATSGLVVAGPISIQNASPGTLDAKKLPLVDASAFVRLDAVTQTIRSLRIRLLRDASVTGQGSVVRGKGQFALDVAKLDLHELHGALRPTQFGGKVNVGFEGRNQNVTATLTDPAAAINLSAKIAATPVQTTFSNVLLTVGQGRARLDGSLKRDAANSFSFKGELVDFNPMALVSAQERQTQPSAAKGSRPRVVSGGNATKVSARTTKTSGTSTSRRIDARVSGSFTASGTLAPDIAAKVQFALRDSVYDGLPLTGTGTLQLAGTRLLPSQAALSIAGNQVDLHGSFGTPRDRLVFSVDAPQLERLGFGLAGKVSAQGDVTGSIAHPNVSAAYKADGVVFGSARVGHAEGQARLHDGATGALEFSMDASNVEAPGLTLQTVVAKVNGTRGNHTVNATAQGSLRGNRLDASIAAHGSLTEVRGTTGWRGTISQLRNRGTPEIDLKSPVTVVAEPKDIELSATSLELEGATLTLRPTSYQNGQIRSAGTLTGVDLARMLALQAEMTGKPTGLLTDLVLQSEWDVNIGPTASGHLTVQRTSGDIQVNAGQGPASLGLEKLAARVDFDHGNQAHLTVDTQSARVGELHANLNSTLTPADGILTLAETSPLTGRITGDVPSLRTTGGLLGPTYILDGNLALRLALAGTVGKPKISGSLTGAQLAATLVDQGIELSKGVVDILVTENVLTFRQVEFHGGKGTIGATGQVQLDADNPNVTAKIIADKLELFGAPDRRLSVSGQATVANAGTVGGLAIDGKFVVDHALFDLPQSSAPRLGDDVVIVRSDGHAESAAPVKRIAGVEKPVGPFAPRANVIIDLGKDFRFRGAGADLGLAGALTVKSAPNTSLAAVGNISVTQNSTYEAFGRKLGIETGYFTFNGPVDNPAINLLAMRRNQEVEAGVRVRGTLRTPVATLVSEPSVTDDEKLSWLLFGHGTDTGNNLGQQNTMAAAFALLGSAGGKRIAQTVGLDEFTVGTSDSGLTDAQVVQVAKALNEHFVLGYEQGLQSAGYLFKLTWLLSRRWSVATQAGKYNGVSLNFTERFD